MIPATFGYTRAGSVDEALRALESDSGARVIAGGQSILPLMKLRLAQPGTLVDIGRLAELKGVRALDDGRLAVGALTTYAELMDSPARHYGVLRDMLPIIGDVQVRNLGTVGGSIAHADPASDLPAALLALDADLVLRSAGGSRTVKADGFFEGAFATGLRPGELLTEIVLPAPLDHAGSAYASLEQPASGYALVGVAAVVVRGPDRRVAWVGVGVTGVHEHAYRAPEVEAALVGSDGSAAAIATAVGHVTDEVEINADIHAGSEYRAAMAVVYARRALEAAFARAG
jgi:aerobic carbon-monoxide dehydrogenase medium subunit